MKVFMKNFNINLIIALSVFLFTFGCGNNVDQDISVLNSEKQIEIISKNVYTNYLSEIENILDPKNLSWPRIITINGKEIIIPKKPDKLLTISLGHDEVLFGISSNDQIVG